MREGYVIMMHTGFPEVNHDLYLWRDRQGLLHASRKMTREYFVKTLCERDTRDMAYAGRVDVPTCLGCVTAP